MERKKDKYREELDEIARRPWNKVIQKVEDTLSSKHVDSLRKKFPNLRIVHLKLKDSQKEPRLYVHGSKSDIVSFIAHMNSAREVHVT